MKASEAIIKCLKKEGVDVVFGYPGGAVIPLYEALRNSDVNHVLVRHEQGAVHAASGFSRSKKSIGVCISTSGPGATNLITGIATAYMDSIPLVIITGQVNSYQIGKDVFQEADMIGATAPFTKHNYLVKDAKDLPRIFREAFYIASSGRPGPVLIDIPRDIQEQEIEFEYPKDINIIGYKPTIKGHKGQIKKIAEKISQSNRPLICVGGGIHCSGATKEFREFVTKTQIPVVHTLMGIGAVESNTIYDLGMLGSHGHRSSNRIITKADLLIIIGARVGDRALAKFKLTDNNLEIIHIDIDPAEVGKILNPTIPVVGDAKHILIELNKLVKKLNTETWLEEISQIRQELDNVSPLETDQVNPRLVFKAISSMCPSDTIFTADVGKNQIWSARKLAIDNDRVFFTSGGLGTMGYSLPAAIGAKIACNDREVVCILGDGSFQMSLTEIATLNETGQKLIIILFNNSNLGMVRELQLNYKGHGTYYGIDFTCNPDFSKLAEAYGINSITVDNDDDITPAISKALESEETYLIEFMVRKDIESTI